MIRAAFCNESAEPRTNNLMFSTVWNAPVRNLVWVAARCGYR